MTLKTCALPAAALLAVLAVLVPSPLAAAARPTAADPAPAAHFHAYVREWQGHTRSLVVRRDHTATEEIYSGCCDHVITVDLTISDVHGSVGHGSARAQVTRVPAVDPSYFDGQHPVPVVGETTWLRLRDGVLHEPLTGATYCNLRATRPGRCGA